MPLPSKNDLIETSAQLRNNPNKTPGAPVKKETGATGTANDAEKGAGRDTPYTGEKPLRGAVGTTAGNAVGGSNTGDASGTTVKKDTPYTGGTPSAGSVKRENSAGSRTGEGSSHTGEKAPGTQNGAGTQNTGPRKTLPTRPTNPNRKKAVEGTSNGAVGNTASPKNDSGASTRIGDNPPKKKTLAEAQQEAFEKKLREAEAKKKKPLSVQRPIVSEDWSKVDPADDPTTGIGAENFKKPKKANRRKRNLRIKERDLELLAFLAKYKYASRAQIERHFNVKYFDRRLTQLKEEGFLWNESVTRTQWLWTPSTAGMDLADLDYPVLAGGRITPSTIGHTLGLVNIGSDLETGKLETNLLGDELEQNPHGETIIHEREISQSYNQHLKLTNDPRVIRDSYIDEWGNDAWTYLLHITHGPKLGKTHKPDLVVDRGGKGKDIAIELELSPKRTNEWKEILTMYKTSPYAHVIYYTHKRSIAMSLNKINEHEVEMPNLSVRIYKPLRSDIPFWG